ncbi:hypothetical protein [Micromonospora saelicesensis]|uniref:hypothetical protein n=1 Tax=Micromonospora saelicesensis TaxID=285676 RepID=UPI000DC420D8|nr:hypothetical protein [Micromonospora saelicesensis]RAO59982.1 hypothetical protein PSN01_02489 [Micromonospora saelicesensis]
MRALGVRRWVNPLAGVYLVVFTVTEAVGTVGATTWIRAEDTIIPALLLWCVSLAVAVRVTSPGMPPHVVLLVLASLVSAFLMLAAAQGLWSAVLTHRGERVVATVISLRDETGKVHQLHYTLADQHNQRIPGELGRWPGNPTGASDKPEGAVGQRVTVVRDPQGLVDPRLPEELVESESGWPLWPGIFAVTAVLSMLAAGRRAINGDGTTGSRRRRPAGRAAAKTGTRPRRKRTRGRTGRRISGPPGSEPSPRQARPQS